MHIFNFHAYKANYSAYLPIRKLCSCCRDANIDFLILFFRMGLIRARLAGARLAKGDVLVFLDAHCEGVVGWLEPLLQRIQESRSSVLVPIIDVIDAKDFHYSVNGYKHFQVKRNKTQKFSS